MTAHESHAGVEPAAVGIVVPTGFSFNLDTDEESSDEREPEKATAGH